MVVRLKLNQIKKTTIYSLESNLVKEKQLKNVVKKLEPFENFRIMPDYEEALEQRRLSKRTSSSFHLLARNYSQSASKS